MKYIIITLALFSHALAIDLNERRKVSEKGKNNKAIAAENRAKGKLYIESGTFTNPTPFKDGFKATFTSTKGSKSTILLHPKYKALAGKLNHFQFKTTTHGKLLVKLAPRKR